MPSRRLAGARLTIDLGALVGNWRKLKAMAAPAGCAAVVKADGYGLGAVPVARALAKAGCDTFFVAHASEGLALRAALPRSTIFILHGPPPGAERELDAHGLTPVLSAPDQIEAWAKLGRELGRALPAAIHFDTGMNRLGLAAAAAERLLAAPDRLAGIAVVLTMSHLACPEEAAQPMNAAQRDRFDSLRRRLSSAPASLANSAGIFLGRDYHYDLVRPGVALYGVDVRPDRPEKMAQVVQLHGKILQVRDVDIGMTVGYGATHHVTRPGRVATVAVGYADGYLRTLSNRGFGFIGDAKVAVVGRVSMDLITLDVSALPTASTVPGTMVELIGPRLPLGELAALAGTIEYEILTRLGTRFQRDYLGGEG